MDQTRTDEELAKELQEGHEEAFTLLFDRYEKKIIRYGQKFLYNYDDVIDAVQETFIKAYRNIQSFTVTRKFSTWLYRIAHNTFINVIKKKGRESVSFRYCEMKSKRRKKKKA
jgi:RNA polymerase sigma-70 factor (ECF subfamily)